MGDAVEYYQDLGLEYNVDYIDTSKEKATPKPEVEEVKEDNVVADEIENPTVEKEPVVEEEVEEVSKDVDEKKDNAEDDNDNLFDLIDSMYQEKD